MICELYFKRKKIMAGQRGDQNIRTAHMEKHISQISYTDTHDVTSLFLEVTVPHTILSARQHVT